MELYVYITIIIGFIAGFLGQRSRMCFVGGMRDLYLIRDSYLFKGLIAFIIAAVVGFIFFNNGVAFPWAVEKGVLTAIPGAPCSMDVAAVILAVVGGLGIGFFAVLSGGCPFRNTVLTAEGNKRAWFYILGFIVAAVVFHLLISDAIKLLFGC